MASGTRLHSSLWREPYGHGSFRFAVLAMSGFSQLCFCRASVHLLGKEQPVSLIPGLSASEHRRPAPLTQVWGFQPSPSTQGAEAGGLPCIPLPS